MSYPHYSCMNKRAKMINFTFQTKSKGNVSHLAIDFTELKVYGERKRKVKSMVLMRNGEFGTNYI
ncbi:Mobile element protein (plasmid) [Candidatus Enterovibrio altilux]|uniref:Mobile element protein n=1 Tax=Candidatus Enterovibrio altilux TaxID=1927128 RepID=A0A291BAZ8_9GAMM|nr:Mobile element protein [Candidatus Enterovibrio luxaltus]